MGTSVILAARLASIAKDVLCDAATHATCRKVIHFESLPQVAIKGKVNQLDVWRPRSLKPDGGRVGLVGRRDEQAELERPDGARARRPGWRGHSRGRARDREDRISQKRPETGASARRAELDGRGRLNRTTQRVSRLACCCCRIARGGPGRAEPGALRDRLLALLGPENARWLPLLNPLFAASLAENEHTASLSADSRAQTTRELLVMLLNVAARATPLLMVLEDAHWMDSASWELAEQAAARVSRLLLLVSIRAQTDTTETLGRLTKRSGAATIHLGALKDDEIREVVCHRLDAEAIEDELAQSDLSESRRTSLLCGGAGARASR